MNTRRVQNHADSKSNEYQYLFIEGVMSWIASPNVYMLTPKPQCLGMQLCWKIVFKEEIKSKWGLMGGS